MTVPTPDAIGRPQAPMAPPDSPTTRRGVARRLASHASTKVILASAIPLLAARLWLRGFGYADLVAAVVVATAFPIFERVLHIAMHVPPVRIFGRTFDPELARSHRRHHVVPGTLDDMLLPPRFLLGLAAIAWLVLPWVLGPRVGWTAGVVFHLGGLLNGWVHLSTHCRVKPRTRYFAWVRRNHHLHHFKDPTRWFSFTGPWLDGSAGDHHAGR